MRACGLRRGNLGVAAVLLTLAVSGCGGSAPTARSRLAGYIKQVNRIESALTPPLTTVTRVGQQFASERAAGLSSSNNFLAAAHERALRAALAQIRPLRAKLAAVPAPATATRLRKLLLKLIDGQIGLTRQLAKLIVFLPRFAVALAPLGPATKRLEGVLLQQQAPGPAAVAALYAAKAAALRQFKAVVDSILAALRRLHAPAVSRPTFVAQVKSLQGMSLNAGKLADALAGGAPSNVAPLLSAFDRAASSTQTRAVARAQVAAIRAYDRHVGALTSLGRQVEVERLRLSKSLQ